MHSCVSLAAIPLFLFFPISDWLGIILHLVAHSVLCLLLFFYNCCFFFFIDIVVVVFVVLGFLSIFFLFFFLFFVFSSLGLSVFSPSLSLPPPESTSGLCFCVCRRPEISFFYSCYCCRFYYCDKQRQESWSFCRVYATYITNIRMLI